MSSRPSERSVRPVPLRLVVRTFSELCITVGVLIILFVAYVLSWTGVKAAEAAEGEIATLNSRWAQQRPAAPSATASPPPYEDGKPFATMYVPRFGAGWEWPVLENTEARTLQKGLGHYSGTARPGETGNFAVAGHRRTYGDPFKDFPRLRPGDAVIVNDGTTWFTYRVAREPYRTVPTDTAVVDPVPRRSGFEGPGRYLTLTTCEPEWGSSHRLIAWAHLDATRPVGEGKPPELTG
ncbi:class E sortase [Streptomyces sp. CAI-24]|uniref:class E sortase n=1 Tax=Streptomyces sp. CAI-24 TaxID=2712892 RepID=UPI0015867DE2|nr:class E sortase [Streptomyces sp. CAI-24]NUV43460.1 class E sortase [Streptomyces sp. CAI-24]